MPVLLAIRGNPLHNGARSIQDLPLPELPEVETVRRGLEPVMAGKRLVRVEQRRPDLRFPFPDGFVGRTEGQAIVRLGRRAMLCHMARIAIIGGGSIGEALLAGLLRAGRQVIPLVKSSLLGWLEERIRRSALAGVAFLPDVTGEAVAAFTARLLEHYKRKVLDLPQTG